MSNREGAKDAKNAGIEFEISDVESRAPDAPVRALVRCQGRHFGSLRAMSRAFQSDRVKV